MLSTDQEKLLEDRLAREFLPNPACTATVGGLQRVLDYKYSETEIIDALMNLKSEGRVTQRRNKWAGSVQI